MPRPSYKAASAFLLSMLLASTSSLPAFAASSAAALTTATPIKHVVIIFGENESFDHYFGTYPTATNPPGEPAFTAKAGTPVVNGYNANPTLLTSNPNLNTANGTGAANPFRLDRSQAHTASMNHAYGPEEQAYDAGKMDLFPKYTGRAGTGGTGVFNTTGLVMGYYDGNTVTALWNYAQHFALSDNSYSTNFGPSTNGAINVISGQTNGAVGHIGTSSTPGTANLVADGQGGYTLYGDDDPYLDVCSTTTGTTVEMQGKNIGDLLNAKNITWGWFEGGFNLQAINANGTTGCARSTTSATIGSYIADYIPHHQPFQYYASTRNPSHARPTSVAMIGKTDVANHQYDTTDFVAAVKAGNFPAVSYLKAPAIQDAHPSNSDPLDEQAFVVNIINLLQQSPEWSSTAVILAYDDSDGWYDHMFNIVNPSTSAQDFFLSTGICAPLGTTGLTAGVVPANAWLGINGKPVNGRCGYGTRQPLLVVSPYAKANFVDHTLTDQSSVVRFIEDNWLAGQRLGGGSADAVAGAINTMFDFTQTPSPVLILNPTLGTVQ